MGKKTETDVVNVSPGNDNAKGPTNYAPVPVRNFPPICCALVSLSKQTSESRTHRRVWKQGAVTAPPL